MKIRVCDVTETVTGRRILKEDLVEDMPSSPAWKMLGE